MTKKILRFLPNIIVSIITIFVMLVLIEIAIRIVIPFPDDSSHSAAMGWRGIPHEEKFFNTDGYKHTIKRNSRGMHDVEHTEAKPSNTFRILMLGDSFTEAQQVGDTETTRYVLEELLNKNQSTTRFEVISGAVGGWGTSQQLVYYRTEGRFYQPDLVLLMFYLGNDVGDNIPVRGQTNDHINFYAPYFPICNGQLDPAPWYYAPGLEPVINECPPLYKLLTNKLNSLYQVSRLYTHLGSFLSLPQNDYFHRDLPWLHHYVPIDNQRYRESYPEHNEIYRYGWQVTFEIIKQLNKETQNDGAQMIVALIDPLDTINAAILSPDEQQARYQHMPYLRETRLDVPERSFVAELTDKNIGVLNLQPFLIEQSKTLTGSLYFPDDGHWNVAGNRVAAESIYYWLNKISILP